MASDQNADFIEWTFKAVDIAAGIGVAIGGWLWTNLVGDVRDIQRQQSTHATNLIQNQLDNERTFASKTDMQFSLNRIHDRLDGVEQKLDDKFGELSGDVKSILTKLK